MPRHKLDALHACLPVGVLVLCSMQDCRFSLMQAAHAEEILVPMITWNLDGQRLNADAGDVQQSLNAIRDYSVFQVPTTTASFGIRIGLLIDSCDTLMQFDCQLQVGGQSL